MAFKPAQFANRHSKNVAPLRYAVRRGGDSLTRCSMQVHLSRDLAAKAGIQDGQGVRLEFDEQRNLGRFVPIDHETRAFKSAERRTGLVAHFPWNGDVEKFMPRSNVEGVDIVPLKVEETSKQEGLTFELPKRS